MAKRIKKLENRFSVICVQLVLIFMVMASLLYIGVWGLFWGFILLLCTSLLYKHSYTCSNCGGSVGEGSKCLICGSELR